MRPVVVLVLVSVLLLTVEGQARQPGHFTLPLPSPDLPDGALTVKVVGSSMSDLRVGQPVQLHRLTDRGVEPVRTVPTNTNGRAHFDNLKQGARYVVSVTVEGQERRSQPFTPAPSGGIRLLLTLGEVSITSGPPADHPPMGDRRHGSQQKGPVTIEPDRDLERGAIRVVVHKGRDRKPLSGAEVILRRGDRSLSSQRTNENGEARLTLPAKEGGGVVVQVRHDGQTQHSRELSPPKEGGLRATFVVFDRPRDPSALVVGPGSYWACQPGEGVLRFMQVMVLQHRDPDAIFDPGPEGLELPLPRGATNAELPEAVARYIKLDRQHGSMRLLSPLPAGGLTLQVFYQLPHRGAEVDFSQRMTLASPRSLVSVVGSEQVSLFGPAVQGPAKKQQGEHGGRAFMLEETKAGSTIEFTIAGLPQRDNRYLAGALVLSGLIALWGLFGALSGPRQAHQRRVRREHLLQKLGQLRRQRKTGGRQSPREQEIMNELKQIWEEPW